MKAATKGSQFNTTIEQLTNEVVFRTWMEENELYEFSTTYTVYPKADSPSSWPAGLAYGVYFSESMVVDNPSTPADAAIYAKDFGDYCYAMSTKGISALREYSFVPQGVAPWSAAYDAAAIKTLQTKGMGCLACLPNPAIGSKVNFFSSIESPGYRGVPPYEAFLDK